MKLSAKLIAFVALVAAVILFAAGPPPGTFIVPSFFTTNGAKIYGTGGITVSSNPPTGIYLIDGSSLTPVSTNGLATTNYVISVANVTSNGLVTLIISSTNGLSRILQFDANQFTVVNGTNVAIKSGALVTNLHTYGITNFGTNMGGLTATNPVFVFYEFDVVEHATLLQPNINSGIEIIAPNGLSVFDVSEGQLTLGSSATSPIINGTGADGLVDWLAMYDTDRSLVAFPQGLGAFTNNNNGQFGWFNGYATPTVTNGLAPVAYVLSTSNALQTQISAKQTGSAKLTNFSNLADGTGALTNNGSGSYGWFNGFLTSASVAIYQTGSAILSNLSSGIYNFTNTTLYGTSTTTVPTTIALAGGHNTNALTISQGPATVGGFDSNGAAFLQISNSATVYPGTYRVFTQTADSTCTNITTVETTWLGTGVGSLTLPAGFWQVGRSVRVSLAGVQWTSASGGNTAIVLKLGSQNVATNFQSSLVLTLAGEAWDGEILLTCRTNSSTVGFIQAQGGWNYPSSQGSATSRRSFFKSTEPIFDTTASMAINLASTNGASTTSFRVRQCSVTVMP